MMEKIERLIVAIEKIADALSADKCQCPKPDIESKPEPETPKDNTRLAQYGFEDKRRYQVKERSKAINLLLKMSIPYNERMSTRELIDLLPETPPENVDLSDTPATESQSSEKPIEDAKEYSKDDIIKALTQVQEKFGKDKAMEIIKNIGNQKSLKDVDSKLYGPMILECKNVMSEEVAF